jgi:4-amino-4-deoxy-L-arabinose transferase-like glycosyltransferase
MKSKAAPRPQGKQFSPVSLWLSFCLALLAQLSLTFDWSVAAAGALYCLAGYFFIRAAGEGQGESSDRPQAGFPLAADKPQFAMAGARREWLVVLALVFIAAFFRLYRLDSQPGSLWLDESLTALNALEIIDGKPAPLWGMTSLDRWRPDWVKTSNLYLYFVLGVFKVFGTGYFGLKAISVLPAIAGIIAGYFLFKALAGRSVAVLAAFLLAVSQWHVTVSRWGWDALLMSLLQLAAYWFLIRGVQSGGKRYFLGGGLLIGLCLYTYVASWIALAIALAFLVIRAARDRAEALSRIRELALFVIGCAIVFAPLGAHYIRHPTDLTVRVSEVSLARTVEQANSYLPLWENVKSHALMFNYRGDNNPRHGFPGAPALDFVTSVFFVLGLAHYLRFWRDPQRLFVIVWFVLGLQGGLLAEPSASPHAYRTLMISAAACLFAAAAAHAFFRAGSATLLNVRHGRAMAVAITTVLLTAIAVDNFRIYFFKRPGPALFGRKKTVMAGWRRCSLLTEPDRRWFWSIHCCCGKSWWRTLGFSPIGPESSSTRHFCRRIY